MRVTTFDTGSPERDRGAALPLVLVMMVILSLVIIPTLNYAVAVVSANNVLSDKNERVEAVKAGLRIALADPQALYQACDSLSSGPNKAFALAPVDINGLTVNTNCYLQGTAEALAGDQLRVGTAATRLNLVPPIELRGSAFSSSTSTSEWLGLTTVNTETDRIWLPRLPVASTKLQARTGTEMQDGFPTCTVFFPGTYANEVVLDGPTFFTSGVYYFQNEVRVESGADVVVGGGVIPGCTTDLDAIFYSENPPSAISMSGLGATWVFGESGRLVVDNSGGSDLSLQFNRRYAPEDDDAISPSQDVSIISVNGAADGPDNTIDLDVPGDIFVPASTVGAGETPDTASSKKFVASRFTPAPAPPEAPTGVVATAYDEAAIVSWDAPYDNNELVSGYRVTASPGGETCTTTGATSCVIVDLDDGDPVTFTVVATNALGDSVPSEPSEEVTPNGSALGAPDAPAAPTIDGTADGVVRVIWTEPTTNGAPIESYTVTGTSVVALPGDYTCDVDVTSVPAPSLTCDVTGLDPLDADGYEFTVVANSAAGSSNPSSPSAVTTATGADPLPTLTPPPAPAVTGPPPIIDLRLADAALATVDIPGYIATPQGRFRIDNPNGHPGVVIGGGILAADYDVVDGRATVGSAGSLGEVGFINQELQRRYLLKSTLADGYEESRAIVQVNENGGYAVNSWEVQ